MARSLSTMHSSPHQTIHCKKPSLLFSSVFKTQTKLIFFHPNTVRCSISKETSILPKTLLKSKRITEKRKRRVLGEEFIRISDVISNSVDIHGWNVIVQNSGKIIGIVDEIIEFSTSPISESVIKEYVLRIVDYSDLDEVNAWDNLEDDNKEERFPEFLVPFVSPIIISINRFKKILIINPPKGLLELGYRKRLLKKLEPELMAFCQQYPKQNSSWNRSKPLTISKNVATHAPLSQLTNQKPFYKDSYMPTRRQLMEAGRHDLIELIVSAGGFLTTAQSLGLRSHRRPSGFWDDLRNLDAEIEWFIATSWIQKNDIKTGKVHYYNAVTFETCEHLPDVSDVSVINPIPISLDVNDEGTAAMPRMRNVLDAKRYDLHNAIILHGGYKSVSVQLGRQVVPKDSLAMLEFELQNFMQKHSLTSFPSFQLLKEEGRGDLFTAIRRCGGMTAVADYMGLRPSKHAKGHWTDLNTAVSALREYIASKSWHCLHGDDEVFDVDDAWNEGMTIGILKMPTHQQLLDAKRYDLRYAFQKFGQRKLAMELGLVPNKYLRRLQ